MTVEQIWDLYTVKRMTAKQISEAHGIPIGTVHVRIYRYRKSTGAEKPKAGRLTYECKHGHPRTPENTEMDRGTPRCKVCRVNYRRKSSASFGADLRCDHCGKDGHSVRTCPKLQAIPGVSKSRARCGCGLLLPCDHAELTERASARRAA